jgi:Trypsin-like peptidase domain/Tetratricopeptide Repeats-Sensor
MSWSDARDINTALAAALITYDWKRAAAICAELMRRIGVEPSPFPEAAAKEIVAALRKKRRFDLVGPVAEAFIRSGQNAPRIRRQYAQGLIEQGILLASEPILQALTLEPLEGDSQVDEAHGLLGRIYKQLYVASVQPQSPYARLFFERALSEYLQTYRFNPKKHAWHGINVVALLHRGGADGISVQNAPDPGRLALDILEVLPSPSATTDAFDLAIRLEALVALGRHSEAEAVALEYSQHPDADAFEFGSTLRQFEQVWRLTDGAPPGSTILPILRAAKLRGENGQVAATPAAVDKEIATVRQARTTLEKNFGEDKTSTLRWYETGLLRTKSVARVDRLNGKGHGTGWLVRSEDFFPNQPPRLLLLTNAHVVSPTGGNGALQPDQVQANFQGLKSILDFEDELVWSSPPDQLDATFLAFKNGPPAAEPMPLFDKKVRLVEPPARVYIVGHPAGRDLEFSLHDNKLLGCSDRLLHYRTPTEPGSSGSPVFEADAWKVIALHHAGGLLGRLDGVDEKYEANEGIVIRSLQEATREKA